MAYIKMQNVMKICEGYSDHCFNSNDAKGQDIADRILNDVVELPTAEVVEVKYGRWKGAGLGDYCCSECWEVYSGGNNFKYCPNCGAKMDGKEGK